MFQPEKQTNETKAEQSTEPDGDVDCELTSSQSSETGNEVSRLITGAYRNAVAATRCCNVFPQGTARAIYLSYPGYARKLEEQSQRVLGLISKVLKSENIAGEIRRRQGDEQLEMVQECNDILFERITTNLDKMNALRRNKPDHMVVETRLDIHSTLNAASPGTVRAGSWNRISNVGTPSRSMVSARLFTAKNISRPQMRFKVPVDNRAQNPFKPALTEKPNSLKPLALLPEYDDAGNVVSFLHPYEFELLKFEPPQVQLQMQQPVLPAPPEKTELMIVDTVEKLQQALDELRQARQIAIDVEHHSYRTFMGITCLVQMSTRTKDYIFDTLTLRENMHILNLVLTDPKVLKILHGGDQDIEWLQRDLSLYIVNMFDTHRAAKALNMARLSLAFLLKHYLDLDVDKSLQLADWRMRPLPQQLIDYARQDTHYLIYVYEQLTNDLLKSEHGQQQALRMVYQMSTEVCKKRYIKPHIGPDSHLDLVRKTKRSFDNRQLYALRSIFSWRDATARQEDESYGYVLPNHMMLQIAESLPREMQGILACCNPIPPLVRQQLHTLHQIVLRAREQPLVKPILEDSTSGLGPVYIAPATKDFNSKLNCPHDFSHVEETRDDLPTLLKRNSTGKLQRPDQQEIDTPLVPLMTPALSLFDKSVASTQDDEQHWLRARVANETLRMPYKRYLAILPLMQQLKIEQAARESSELLKRRLCPAEPAPASLKLEFVKKEEDELYRLPLKEQLKRKNQPATPSERPSMVKRSKQEERTSHAAPQIESESTPVNDEMQNAKDSEDDSVTEVPVGKHDTEDPTPVLSRRQQKRQHNQHFKAKSRMQAQSSNRPVQLPGNRQNFDYKNVDFRQFQGGAQRARGTEIKTQMRGKNRPNNRNNKKFNKLFTFSNARKDGKK